MGVRGLQTYLENYCPSGARRVRIEDLVEEYRSSSESPDEEVVIVVDGSSCIRHLYGELEWIGGGQFKQYVEKAKFFVSQFTKLGVKLVFFFDGPTVEAKRKTWIERRLGKLESMYYVLDTIEDGVPSHYIDNKKYFQLPAGLRPLSRKMFEIVCGCEVRQALVECDEEIANYARNNKVFAILGQDSDFVIYDKGGALYLSTEKLDLENMTTVFYDHEALALSLRIPSCQLPVLATLMGTDVILHQDLRPFHVKMMKHHYYSTRVDYRTLIPNLAELIRTLPTDRELLYKKVDDLSRTMFGTSSRAEEIWTSIQSYNAMPSRDDHTEDKDPTHWDHLVSKALNRHQKNEIPSVLYATMKGLPYETCTSIEDFRKKDLPWFSKATELIRRRTYGILLHEKPLDDGKTQHHVPEWCNTGPGSLDRANYVSAIPPTGNHPGLLILWSEDKDDEEVKGLRWQLFVHGVSPNLNVDHIRKLPSYLVMSTLILFYLNEMSCLEEWDIDAVLATAVCLPHYSLQMLKDLPENPLTTRGIRVANLVMRSIFVLYYLLAACGNPLSVQETAPWLFFDGKLFQFKYNEAKVGCGQDQLCEYKGDSMKSFQMARRIVLGQN